MDKPSKLNERLTLIANIAVVLGIIFLGLELRQNTNMMRAQVRDSITEKQMTYYGWLSESPDLAALYTAGNRDGVTRLPPESRSRYRFVVLGILREFENSHYQAERGLFTPAEFEARVDTWRTVVSGAGARQIWAAEREAFSPGFRAEIDRLVAEIEN